MRLALRVQLFHVLLWVLMLAACVFTLKGAQGLGLWLHLLTLEV